MTGRLTRMFAERLGGSPELADHASPAVLADIPRSWPVPEPDYLAAPGTARRPGRVRITISR